MIWQVAEKVGIVILRHPTRMPEEFQLQVIQSLNVWMLFTSNCQALPQGAISAICQIPANVRQDKVSAKLVELCPSRERCPSGLRSTLGKRV
jgi:hypothetical protein